MNDKPVSSGFPVWPIVIAVAVLAAAGAAFWAYVPAAVAPVVSSGAVVQASTGATASVARAENPIPAGITDTSTLGNPASLKCASAGGSLVVKKNLAGGEYGVCFFEDNRQCEEWALFYGFCPEGGKKVTGYDNDSQTYCSIAGGTVHMETKPISCELPDGAGSCSVDAFYAKGYGCQVQ